MRGGSKKRNSKLSEKLLVAAEAMSREAELACRSSLLSLRYLFVLGTKEAGCTKADLSRLPSSSMHEERLILSA